MKTSFIVFFVLLCFQNVSGQGIFTLSIDSSFQEHQDVDLTQNNLYYRFEADMKNIGDSSMNIGWTVFDVQGCPSDWNLIVTDKYIEYILDPNFDYALAIDLLPDEEAPYNVLIYPRDVPGCCSMKVQFYNADNASEIYDTSYYQLKLNVESCTVTNTTSIVENENVKVFPNPTVNTIQIESLYDFEYGEIISSTGKKIKDIASHQKSVQTDELEEGLYFIILHFSDKKRSVSSFVKK